MRCLFFLGPLPDVPDVSCIGTASFMSVDQTRSVADSRMADQTSALIEKDECDALRGVKVTRTATGGTRT